MLDSDPTFLRELVQHHVSGQLRVAPEHVSNDVLTIMGKPSRQVYEQFVHAFDRENARAGKEQYVVPYLMSSHPGSTLKDAVELAEFCRNLVEEALRKAGREDLIGYGEKCLIRPKKPKHAKKRKLWSHC